MEGQGVGLDSSYSHHLEYVNSKAGPETGNLQAVLRSLTHLPFAHCTPVQKDQVFDLPENRLGFGVFRRGLEGALKSKVEPWP